jgi:molybdopterin converting factor small subunit
VIIPVTFYSYFRELTGTARVEVERPAGSTLGDLHAELLVRFPPLAAMRKSTLIAVGLEYQNAAYILQPGDEVAFFPPVQGG